MQRIQFLLIVRERSHIQFYTKRLGSAIPLADKKGIQLIVKIAVTGDDGASMTSSKAEEGRARYQLSDEGRGDTAIKSIASRSSSEAGGCCCNPRSSGTANDDEISIRSSKRQSYTDEKNTDEKSSYVITQQISRSSGDSPQPGGGCCCAKKPETKTSERPRRGDADIIYLNGRPDISQFIRKPIEATGGETAITVCGGKSLVAKVRNSTAKLSDERAVHKGTGANGIFLHVEEYCF